MTKEEKMEILLLQLDEVNKQLIEATQKMAYLTGMIKGML